MGIFDRVLGRRPDSTSDAQGVSTSRLPSGFASDPTPEESLTNEQAIERYRYLLRTAPPEAIEQAHTEAFALLTPAQRRLVLEGLDGDLPPQEQADRDDPCSLARLATRAELRRPGTLERTFGGVNPRGDASSGGLLSGSFLQTVAAVVVGTAVADAVFSDGTYAEGYQDGTDAAGADPGSPGADGAYDAAGDLGGVEFDGNDS